MEGEQPYLGNLLSRAIHHLLPGMILQVNVSGFPWCTSYHKMCHPDVLLDDMRELCLSEFQGEQWSELDCFEKINQNSFHVKRVRISHRIFTSRIHAFQIFEFWHLYPAWPWGVPFLIPRRSSEGCTIDQTLIEVPCWHIEIVILRDKWNTKCRACVFESSRDWVCL